MSLWWMEPGWKQTGCMRCGTNIWDSGGDPDHGLCFGCFEASYRENEVEQLRLENEQLKAEIAARKGGAQ